MAQRRALIKILAWVTIGPLGQQAGAVVRRPISCVGGVQQCVGRLDRPGSVTRGRAAVTSPGRVLNNRFRVAGGQPIRPQPQRGRKATNGTEDVRHDHRHVGPALH